MIKAVLVAGSLVVSLGACAERNEYKVVDAHGWPVSTWDARGADFLVMRCPTRVAELPRVDGDTGPNPGLGEGRVELAPQRPGDIVLVSGGVTRDVILDARTRRAYDERYCYQQNAGLGIAETEPRTVKIAVQRRPLAPTEDRAASIPSDATSYAAGASSVTSSSIVPTINAAPGAIGRVDTTR